jgi:hypothetical protein
MLASWLRSRFPPRASPPRRLRSREVGGLAYAITAGMLLYVFVKDGTSGGQLVVLTLSLVVYAIHVPLLIGFTVARYDPLR